jgi:hypothetical protein
MKLDVFRIYDRAMMDIVLQGSPNSDKLTVDGKDVPGVFATPERAQLGLLRQMGLLDAHGRPKDKVPYPYFSLARIYQQMDLSRRNTGEARVVRYADDLLSVAQSRFPQPMDYVYQLDFWSRYRAEANEAWFWIKLNFPTDGEIKVMEIDLHEPYGKQRHHLFLTELNDTTQLETDEKERVTRITATFTLKGWLLEAFETYMDIPLNGKGFTKRVKIIRKTKAEMQLVKPDWSPDGPPDVIITIDGNHTQTLSKSVGESLVLASGAGGTI